MYVNYKLYMHIQKPLFEGTIIMLYLRFNKVQHTSVAYYTHQNTCTNYFLCMPTHRWIAG